MLGPQPGVSLQLHNVQGPRPEYSDRANVSPACRRCFQKHKRMGRHKAATYPIRHDISRVPEVMLCVRRREMFTSKLNVTAPWDRWDFVALTLAVFITIWAFALKLKTFYDLGYSGDLFVHVQLDPNEVYFLCRGFPVFPRVSLHSLAALANLLLQI